MSASGIACYPQNDGELVLISLYDHGIIILSHQSVQGGHFRTVSCHIFAEFSHLLLPEHSFCCTNVRHEAMSKLPWLVALKQHECMMACEFKQGFFSLFTCMDH